MKNNILNKYIYDINKIRSKDLYYIINYIKYDKLIYYNGEIHYIIIDDNKIKVIND